MTKQIVLLGITFFVGLTAYPSKSLAAGPRPLADRLACISTIKLKSGKTETAPAVVSDHEMFGKVVSASLRESGNETAPLEMIGVVGTLTQKSGNLNIMLNVSFYRDDPTTGQINASSATGNIVLSGKISNLKTGEFVMEDSDVGSLIFQCALK